MSDSDDLIDEYLRAEENQDSSTEEDVSIRVRSQSPRRPSSPSPRRGRSPSSRSASASPRSRSTSSRSTSSSSRSTSPRRVRSPSSRQRSPSPRRQRSPSASPRRQRSPSPRRQPIQQPISSPIVSPLNAPVQPNEIDDIEYVPEEFNYVPEEIDLSKDSRYNECINKVKDKGLFEFNSLFGEIQTDLSDFLKNPIFIQNRKSIYDISMNDDPNATKSGLEKLYQDWTSSERISNVYQEDVTRKINNFILHKQIQETLNMVNKTADQINKLNFRFTTLQSKFNQPLNIINNFEQVYRIFNLQVPSVLTVDQIQNDMKQMAYYVSDVQQQYRLKDFFDNANKVIEAYNERNNFINDVNVIKTNIDYYTIFHQNMLNKFYQLCAQLQ